MPQSYYFLSFEALRVWPLNMYLPNPCLEILPLRSFLTSLVPPISALIRVNLLCSSLNIFPATVCIYTQHLWFSYTNTCIHLICWREGTLHNKLAFLCSILCTVKLKLFHTKYEIMSLILINKNSKSHSTVCIFFNLLYVIVFWHLNIISGCRKTVPVRMREFLETKMHSEESALWYTNQPVWNPPHILGPYSCSHKQHSSASNFLELDMKQTEIIPKT